MVRNLVVVGASTGGAEALCARMRSFPGNLDAAVLAVDPLFRSAARSMPGAAMRRLAVDYVLPLVKIGRLVAELTFSEGLTCRGLDSPSFLSYPAGGGREVPSCAEACGDRD